MAASFPVNFSFLRVVRVFRLVRVVRLLRVLRLISELRTLVASLAGSMKSSAWTLFMLFVMIYISAIFFSQVCQDFVFTKGDEEDVHTLEAYFGTMGLAILTLV